MNFDNLNSDNVLLFAMKAYDKPNMIISEFKDDMKRFNYLKRLFKRHRNYKDVKEQLILNHLIVLYNVFGPEVATKLLFYKMAKEDYPVLKTYLLFLNCMPEVIRGIKGSDILSSEIEIDFDIAEGLRGLK